MIIQALASRELETYARVAAERLSVPFVTAQIEGDQNAQGHYMEASWIGQHPELDVARLTGPNAAIDQNLPFFACVPIKDSGGQHVGSLCCGDSEARDLNDGDLAQLRAIAAQIATDMRTNFGVFGQSKIKAVI
jgi:GAF domain-containing protein